MSDCQELKSSSAPLSVPLNATDEKKKNPRDIELVILKNRNGETGGKVDFKYYTLFNYFMEA